MDFALKFKEALSGIYFTTLGGDMSFLPPPGATTCAQEYNKMTGSEYISICERNFPDFVWYIFKNLFINFKTFHSILLPLVF